MNMKNIISASIMGVILFVTPVQAETMYVNASALNVRKQPTIESEIITTLSRNTQIETEIKDNEEWSQIIINDEIGYIYNYYLSSEESTVERLYEPSQFKRDGVIKSYGWRWTWYSERVLSGGGLKIPGRHANDDGYICDENGYICLASVDLSKGSVVETPFGYYGKVYDSGCPSGTLDVYVNW